MIEDVIREIERTQRRILKTRAHLKETIERQKFRLETNRRVIDEASEYTDP